MDLSKFAERLSELIFDAGTTPTELSEKLGCGNATISHYVTGRFLPTLEMTVRLADFFQCTTDYLLGIDNENRAHTFKPRPPFGQRFVEVCKSYNISRYRLQKLTEISESTMRYWVKGKTEPSIANVVKIADKLKCSVDFVLGREV